MSERNLVPPENGGQATRKLEGTPSAPLQAVRHRRSERHQADGGETLTPAQRLDLHTGGETRAASLLETRESTAPRPRQLTGEPRVSIDRPAAQRPRPDERGGFAPTAGQAGGNARARLQGAASRPDPAAFRREDSQPGRVVREPAPKQGRRHTVLTVLLILLLVLALAVVGLLLLPEGTGGPLGSVKQTVTDRLGGLFGGQRSVSTAQPASARDLTVAPDTGSAPLDVTFSLTTTGSVTNVRLVDADGEPLSATTNVQQNNQQSTAWVLTRRFAEPYTGPVSVQLEVGESWVSSDQTAVLSIAAAPAPVATDAPTEAPPQEAEVVSITASPPLTPGLPAILTVTVTTNEAAESVQLTDDEGTVLNASLISRQMVGTDQQWVMNLTLPAPYEGNISAGVRQRGEWIPSAVSVYLSVGQAAPEEPAPGGAEDAAAPEDWSEPDVPDETEDWGEPGEGDVDPADLPDPEADDVNWDEPEGVEPPEATPVPPDAAPTQAPLPGMEAQPTPTLAPSPTPTVGTVTRQLDPVVSDDETLVEETVVEEPVEDPAGPAQETGAAEAPVWQTVAEASEKASPKLITSSAIYQNKKKLTSYSRDLDSQMHMGDDASYMNNAWGVLTFRGSSFRKNAAEGTVGDLTGMEVKWRAETGSVKGSDQTYYGMVWASQPLIMRWSQQVRPITNIIPDKVDTKNLREVIAAGNDGKIYFLDLADGQKTRDPIDVGFPMHATPSISTDGYPYMVVGQYARRMKSGTGKIGLRAYNLLNQSALEMIDGLDSTYKRALYNYGSFQTSPLFDHTSGTMLAVGTNGLFYVSTLKNAINLQSGAMDSKVLDRTVLRTKAKGETDKQVAVESSPVAWENYCWYADLGGVLRCVDVNTLTTVWAVDVGDGVRASLALDRDASGALWLYAADTLNASAKGNCHIACYNAMTGEERWSFSVGVTKYSSGKYSGVIPGVMASPVVGENALSPYVYYAVSLLTTKATEAYTQETKAVPAVLMAIEKATGSVVWTLPLDGYAYSSPVAVYNEDGHGWICQASSTGTLLLLDGATGALTADLKLEGAVTASPAVAKGTLVIGTTGKDTCWLYGIELK